MWLLGLFSGLLHCHCFNVMILLVFSPVFLPGFGPMGGHVWLMGLFPGVLLELRLYIYIECAGHDDLLVVQSWVTAS